MAKLSKAMAKKVNTQEGGSFEALPEGIYVGKLVEVRTDGKGAAGPYWTWEFDVQDEGFKGRKLWVNTSLADNALWKLKEVFTAFGYDADTDTDELIGESVKLRVSQRVIEQGSRKGEIGNNVERLMEFDSEEGDDDEDDVF